MRDRARVWAVLLITFVTFTLATRLLASGRIAIDSEMATVALAVTAAQLVALEALRWLAFGGLSQPVRVAPFFVVWLALALAHTSVSISVSLVVFHRVDLTTTATFLLLAMPTVQAAVLFALTGAPRQWRPRLAWQRVAAHPLAWPVLWIDAIALPAGLLWLHHPVVGIASAAPLQRRWMGTKFAAATIFLLIAARRRAGARADRAALLALAVVLAAIGVNAFVPWLYAVTGRLPPPLSAQPPPVIWLEVYGAMLIVTIIVVDRAGAALERAADRTAGLAAAGVAVLFLATLALIMNAVSSLRPLDPWAGLAMAGGSAAATCFAVAAVVAATPPAER